MSIPWEDIGAREQGRHCLGCLSCYWICPADAIEVAGRLGYMAAHVQRYKRLVGEL